MTNSSDKGLNLRSRLRSFAYAWNGICYLFKNTPNARIHLFAALLAMVGGFLFNVSTVEWLIIVVAIGVVLGFEAFNSAIESLCDLIEPDIHPKIKIVKDLSAGAVLLVAISSFIVALLIFVPKFIDLLG